MSTFDADIVVIGAGMSGLSGAIRASMLGKKVVLFEKHLIAGGLNSYYSRGKREFDVGLHALTNFAPKKSRGAPLLKVLRQLRIPYDDLNLEEHLFSKIHFLDKELKFSNSKELIFREIETKFPNEFLKFKELWDFIVSFPDEKLYGQFESAKEFLKREVGNDLLVNMILSPCLIYGSALENDIDLGQFVIMFRALFIEGLARPKNGIRGLINTLLKRSQEEGVELFFNNGVEFLEKIEGGWQLRLKNNKTIKAKEVISSIGYEETLKLLPDKIKDQYQLEDSIQRGKMSFTETIIVTNNLKVHEEEKSAIVFYNGNLNGDYRYEKPKELFSDESAVICFPESYHLPHGSLDNQVEGTIRLTFMANFDLWTSLKRSQYKLEKEKVYQKSIDILKKLYPSFSEDSVVFKDVFTPKTIFRYTKHEGGAVYGSPHKIKNGIIGDLDLNLSLCGTDQGFLGVVGAMLSGLMVASQTCQKLGL